MPVSTSTLKSKLSVGAAPERASRTDTAFRKIKQEIMRNRLQSGYQCTETELAEQLAISRTPVHEALVRLEQEGLIELRPRHGMRVLPISIADLRDIYDLLCVLEPECAAMLARQQLDASQLSKLDSAARDMRAAVEREDLDAWAAADDRFHRLQLEFVENRRLANILGNLLDQAHRVRMFTLQFRDLPVRSTEDHEEMVALLKRGDAKRLSALFRRHRATAARELFAILKRFRLEQL